MAILAAMVVGSLWCGLVAAQENTGSRARWFVEDRFGMFIHWGAYSGAEGVWKGEKLRYDNDYAEWIQFRNRIDKDEYLTLLERFDWDAIDPERWVLLAKRAGMKYITITAKHHDGFALWDSAASSYNVAYYSSPRRDILGELAAACQKHGLELGLYYSHWVDWEHPYGWDHSKEVYGISPEQFDQYWQEKVIPQIRELLTGYGDIGMMWFDMWIHHSETVVTNAQLVQLKTLIRELQPNCLINSRLGLSVEEDSDVDYRTMNDNELGNEKLDFPWQTPATVAHSWGFHSLENEWKSTTSLLRSLINNVSLNGNLMLNIGPRANGDVSHEIANRLEAMGAWLAVNGESIYGSGAFDLRSNQHDWGNITFKQVDSRTSKLYLHVYNWPLDRRLRVTGVGTAPSKIHLLADPRRSELSFGHTEIVTNIELPASAPDPYVSVVVMEFEQPLNAVKGFVAASMGGGYALRPNNAVAAAGDARARPASRFGSIPSHVRVSNGQTYRWKIYIDEPGSFFVDASYSFQGAAGDGNLIAKMNEKEWTHRVQPTGKTVGEPRSDWVIDSFDSFRLGEVAFSAPGEFEITMEITMELTTEQSPIDFNWLWLEEK